MISIRYFKYLENGDLILCECTKWFENEFFYKILQVFCKNTTSYSQNDIFNNDCVISV